MFENVKITTLPNGARIATSAMTGVNSCAIQFVMATGSRSEKDNEAGWSHFMEHMAFKGSDKRPSRRAITRPFERMGGMFNASTGTGSTNYMARVPAHGMPKAVDILGDMVAHPLFPKSEIERERKVVLEENKQSLDDPWSRLSEMARKAIWPRHPMGRSIGGTPESLARITADALHAFHHDHYTSQGALMVAAGRLEHEQVVDLARPALEALPDNPVPRSRRLPRRCPVKPIAVDWRDVQQAKFSITFRCPPLDDSSSIALRLLSAILGDSSESRLFRKVRERHGLAYSITSFTILFKDGGAFVIQGSVDSKRIEKSVALCGREIIDLAKGHVGRRELSDAKAMDINALLLRGETTWDQAVLLEDTLQYYGRPVAPEEDADKVRAVTAEEIKTVADKIFRPENCNFALILPNDCKADPEKLRESIFQ